MLATDLTFGRDAVYSATLRNLPQYSNRSIAHNCAARPISIAHYARKRSRGYAVNGMSAGNAGNEGQLLRTPTRAQILLWPPQLLAYTRLLLLVAGLVLHQHSALLGYIFFLSNFILDGFDGALARRFNQATKFGAFLDVAVDIISRGMLWALAVEGPLSAVPIILETFTFVCTHTVSSGAWKTNYFLNAPGWVSGVMKNGFKTPVGSLTIAGLMGLPLWLYAGRFLPGTLLAAPALGAALIVGRLLCASVELWVLCSHMGSMLSQDVADRTKQA